MENSTDDIAYYNDYNEESSNKTDTDIKDLLQTMLNQNQSDVEHYAILFDPLRQTILIGLYVLIFVLGMLFNAAIIWVILGKYIYLYGIMVLLRKNRNI